MKTFYFDTGVRPENCHGSLYTGQVWRGGTKQIPFDCEDVPNKAQFMFACDDPGLPEATQPNVIVREIHNSSLCSKHAYFRIP